jgi:GDPmannose 4,6-dehydratase
MKKALIFGIAGQDGSYLSELLLEKGYAVYGFDRYTHKERLGYVLPVLDKIEVINGDVVKQGEIDSAIKVIKPDEVYNFTSPSFIPFSWDYPIETADVSALGVTRILEAIRKFKPNARFYQASSSEMFGDAKETPQSEGTPFSPRNPYGVAKLYGYWVTVNYRERYNIFACSGICYNHESPRRGTEFVTRKVTSEVAKIKLGLSHHLKIGNLESRRDWGFAGDYVKAMWLMLQYEQPSDYVIATNETHSIKEFIELSFSYAGLDWQKYVVVDKDLFRPAETYELKGDFNKAKKNLSWEPEVKFKDLVKMMVEADLDRVKSKAGEC